jgi:hypothetical protein
MTMPPKDRTVEVAVANNLASKAYLSPISQGQLLTITDHLPCKLAHPISPAAIEMWLLERSWLEDFLARLGRRVHIKIEKLEKV